MASKGNLGGGDGSTEYNSGKAAGQPGGSQTCKEMGSVSTSRLPNDGAPRKSRGKPSGSKRQGMAY